MGFFDELGKTISKGVNTISSTGKDTAEQIKLKNDISNAQKMIQRQYNIIGEMFYNFAKGNSTEPDYSEAIKVIDEQLAIIEASNARIETLKNMSICPNCGATVEPGTQFCPRCGVDVTLQPEPAPVNVQPEGKVCPTCGAPVAPGAKFCVACGTKLEEAESVTEGAVVGVVIEPEEVEAVEEAPAAEETIEQATVETAEEITEAAPVVETFVEETVVEETPETPEV